MKGVDLFIVLVWIGSVVGLVAAAVLSFGEVVCMILLVLAVIFLALFAMDWALV